MLITKVNLCDDFSLSSLNSHRLLLPGRKENNVPYTLLVLVARCVCVCVVCVCVCFVCSGFPTPFGHNGAFLNHIIFLCLSLIVGVVLTCSSQVKMKQEIVSSQIRVLPLVSACEQDYVVKCVR